MKTKKYVKSILLGSSAVCLLCLSVWSGSTYAWFTSAVSSHPNTIQTGNLDLKVSYMPFGGDPETDWEVVSEETSLFEEEAIYEPGYQEAFWLKFENTGTLDLKYDFGLDVIDEVIGRNVYAEEICLSNFLDVKVSEPMGESDDVFDTFKSLDMLDDRSLLVNGKLSDNRSSLNRFDKMIELAASANEDMQETSEVYHLVVLEMPLDVGNEVNYMFADPGASEDTFQPQLELGVRITAVQASIETDSLDRLYDEEMEKEEVEDEEIVTPE